MKKIHHIYSVSCSIPIQLVFIFEVGEFTGSQLCDCHSVLVLLTKIYLTTIPISDVALLVLK
jgi:hypothetical protein